MKQSAGLLMVRQSGPLPEFLLAHPGGPFFSRKDAGHWTLPKGQVEPGESPLETAIREFGEETGFPVSGPFASLGFIDQSKKRVHAWAFEGNADPNDLVSNRVELEWPPRSGRMASFPEIDRVAWFDPRTAARYILPAQAPLLLRALAWLTGSLS